MYNKLLFPITLLSLPFQLHTLAVSPLAEPYFVQAESLKKKANTTQAITMYQRVIDLDPKCIEAYRELSIIFKSTTGISQNT